jgi:uncharacterized RDD family membrane protein YckC
MPPGYGPAPGYGVPPGYPMPGGYRPVAPPALSPAGQPLANFGDRLAAYLIDSAILTAIGLLIATPAFIIFFVNWTSTLDTYADPYRPAPDPSAFFADVLGPFVLLEAGLLLLALALYYVYDVEMMHRSGQTVGKKMMKIRVVPLDPTAALTRLAAAKRYGVQFVGGSFVPLLGLLDGLWQLGDKPYQQCLHDKAAGTIVIKVPA